MKICSSFIEISYSREERGNNARKHWNILAKYLLHGQMKKQMNTETLKKKMFSWWFLTLVKKVKQTLTAINSHLSEMNRSSFSTPEQDTADSEVTNFKAGSSLCTYKQILRLAVLFVHVHKSPKLWNTSTKTAQTMRHWGTVTGIVKPQWRNRTGTTKKKQKTFIQEQNCRYK